MPQKKKKTVKKKSEVIDMKRKKATVSEIVQADRKMVEAQSRLKTVQRKYNEALKAGAVEERIVQEIKDGVRSLPRVTVPKVQFRNGTMSKESVVLLGSCWHAGEVINGKEMGGLNSYDFEMFARRYQFLVDTTVEFTQQKMRYYQFDELQVVLLGDMVSGLIHEELEVTNELTIVDQTLLAALVVAQGLLELAQHFPRVIVTGVVGNHGRVRQQKRYKFRGHESWDRVFYETLAMLTQKQTNISYNLPRSYWALLNIQGHSFLAAHGDTVRSSLGIPFYGLKREAMQWSRLYASQGTFIEYLLLSHFHTKAALQEIGGELIMNGSLKGGDEYALSLGLYSEPMQLLFGVHKDKGKTWELRLQPKFLEAETKLRYRYEKDASLASQLLR